VSKTNAVALVVGPCHEWRLPVVTALQRGGYLTLEASNGFEALVSAIDSHIDLLISGDEMVDLSGGELIEIIRRHNAIAHCILISASGEGAGGLPGNVEFLVALFEEEGLLHKKERYIQ
jgi:CheY-like chemotaxis protein